MHTEFHYYRPENLEQLFQAMDKQPQHLIMAGATDVLVDIRADRACPEMIIDIKKIEQLSGIREEKGQLFIGALVTINDLANNALIRQHFPCFREVVDIFACYELRHRATIGGNIGRSSPCADLPPLLMVLEAEVIILSAKGERSSPIEQFFTGPGQNILESGEIIRGVRLPLKKTKACFMRADRGKGMDLALVNIAVSLDNVGKVKIALGAVAAKPVRAYHCEQILTGTISNLKAIDHTLNELHKDISPITDVRATAKYRQEMAKILCRKALVKILDLSG